MSKHLTVICSKCGCYTNTTNNNNIKSILITVECPHCKHKQILTFILGSK